jgi:hypothetical protein
VCEALSGATKSGERSWPGRFFAIAAFFSALALVRLNSVGAMST